jgi:hypothetical protein
MVKETKYLKKLARKAEVLARVSPDDERAKELSNLAKAQARDESSRKR